MKYNKFNAFTLAEIMVLLLTLSILMAAFAPVFTRRYSNVTTDEVWTFIAGDPNYNAYFDAPNKMFKNQAFIGLQPRDADSVDDLVKDDTTPLYSKVVIGASQSLGTMGSNNPQQQMQFRYGDTSMGSLVATLFAGKQNLLLGGPYYYITNTDGNNASFGIGTLEKIASGKRNTAVGYKALNQLTIGNDNTAIGYNAGYSITTNSGNTLVGTNAGSTVKKGDADYNTLVGYEAGQNVQNSYNTAIGNYALKGDANGKQIANTAVGFNALNKAKSAVGNTAVGAYALQNLVDGNYNTAIGYNSCNFIGYSGHNYSKITCIGADSAKEDKSGDSGTPGLPTHKTDVNAVPDRVFIGTVPNKLKPIARTQQEPFAVLEVHNSVKTPNLDMKPTPNGEESVVVNGNLVVRGQSYFEIPIARLSQPWVLTDKWVSRDNRPIPKGLVLFKTDKNYGLNDVNVFAGWDGAYRDGKSYETCDGSCQRHDFEDMRPNCICTAVGPSYSGDTSFIYKDVNEIKYSSTSYDWYSTAIGNNGYNEDCSNGNAAKYKDLSTDTNIVLTRTPKGNKSDYSPTKKGSRETDKSYAHLPGHSCCPNLSSGLSSDIRLKNVGEKFTAGLDEIKKINVYNYTFKNDVNKLPQVGVIAQDLKTVFPNAVTKGADGYYRIRWSEMLYAAVNAIKTLNSKVEALASKIATDKERMVTLKRDNAAMYAQLDKLADELEMLEAKKK